MPIIEKGSFTTANLRVSNMEDYKKGVETGFPSLCLRKDFEQIL